MDFLHTSALLPQSVYPTDLRGATIRHRGGDLYGKIPAKQLGGFAYTVYAGLREDNAYGGYPYLLSGTGGHFTSYGGLQVGEDLHWYTPVKDLVVGVAHMDANVTGSGTWTLPGLGTIPYSEYCKKALPISTSGSTRRATSSLASEYRRYWRDQEIFNNMWEVQTDVRGWYVEGSYRVSKRLEFGSYYPPLRW